MSRLAFFCLVTLLVAACSGRAADRTSPDMGRDGSTGDAAMDLGVDAGTSDASDGGADLGDDAGSDAGPTDLGVDLGEPCGFAFCGAGTYCCAPACNLCYDDLRVCGSSPCAGVDAGPRPTDGGPPPGDMGPRCGAVSCAPGTVCMSCRTPFGVVPECLPAGSVC